MRRISTLSTIVATLGLVAAGLGLAAPAQAAEVNIPDPNLKACINERLGQQPEDPITDTQAATITSMSCFQRGVSDLEGIASLSNLEWVELGANNINNVGPLIGLTKITSLFMNSNQVTDLTPLAELGTLTTLQVSDNGISDVAPLAGLSNLKSLSLASNQISDVAPLANLKQLDTLWLHFNRISEVAPLADFPLLKRLSLTGNQISDVSPLNAIANQIGVAADQYLDARNQTIRLADISVGLTQNNPLLGFDGDRVVPTSGSVPVEFAANGESWRYTDTGSASMPFDRQPNGAASVNFSGRILQNVVAAASTLQDDTASTPFQTTVTVDVLANDGAPGESPLDPSTLALLGAAGNPVSSLATPEGTYEIADAKVRFTPAQGFSGTTSVVRYQVANAAGLTSSASLTVIVGSESTDPTPPIDPTPVDPTPGTGLPGTGTPAPAERLANTGSGAEPALGLAGLLLLGGGALAAASRLRRKPSRSH